MERVSAEENKDVPRPTCAEDNVRQATEVNMDKIKDVRNYAKHQQITKASADVQKPTSSKMNTMKKRILRITRSQKDAG